MDTSPTSSRSLSLFIAVLVVVVGVVVAVLFSSTPQMWERAGEVAALVAGLLVLSWVWSGGAERLSLRLERWQWEGEISLHEDFVPRLRSFGDTARRLFPGDSTHAASFAFVANSLENAVFGGNASNVNPPPNEQERLQAQLAQQIRLGWQHSTTVREQSWDEALRLMEGPAKRESGQFAAAFRLVRAYLHGDFEMAADYQRKMRQAHAFRFRSDLNDEWTRFRDTASHLAAEWERYALEVGQKMGIEGPYNLAFIGELT